MKRKNYPTQINFNCANCSAERVFVKRKQTLCGVDNCNCHEKPEVCELCGELAFHESSKHTNNWCEACRWEEEKK